MRTRRLRTRLALLLAALLALTGLTAAPALADDPAEIHGLKGEYYTHSAPGDGQSGLNLGADGGTGDIMDEHGYPSPALPPRPDGKRALVGGEYGGLGLAVPGHAWSVQQSYVDVDPATCTDDYLAKLDEVRALVCRGSNGAVYTQIADVEGELNGFLTYDRAVLKPDTARLKTAHQELIHDASRVTPTGCPAPRPVLN
ncbi:hydrolase [Streptomyces azureus]|uniref:Hydrolase n=1 Tax=Streptomyces azureus TaxID=146537 RepID=A0A0K8PWD6_STRAJ|nr:hydrolase [Streptomyces azureus]